MNENKRMKKKAFLSVGEAGYALGVSVKTIQRWNKASLLHSHHVFGQGVWKPSEKRSVLCTACAEATV